MKARPILRQFAWPAALAIAAACLAVRGDDATTRPATRPSTADELRQFRFRGQPIHPACVMKLGIELSEGLPAVAGVDVEGCTESQQHPAAFTVRDGWVRIELEGGGWFDYRQLAVSPRETHVLHTRFSGGGTGVFEDLLLVRFSEDRVSQDASRRLRVMMTSVGSFTLGDRDDGDIRVEATRIVVGRSRYRESETPIELDATP